MADKRKIDPLGGKRMKAARLWKGMTQWELARAMNAAGVAAATWTGKKVSYIESYKRQIQPDEVEPLETILGFEL